MMEGTEGTEAIEGLERSAYRSRWDDGTLDVFGGVGVLLLGLCWMADLVAVGAVVPAMVVPFWVVARKRFTEPRIGRVRFGAARRDAERGAFGWLAVVGVAVLAVVLTGYLTTAGLPEWADDWLTTWVAALPVALIGLLVLVGGLMLGLGRFIAYAGLLIVVGWGGVRFDWEPGVQIALAGGLLAIAGMAVIVRFARAHPRLDGTGLEP